MDNLLYPGESYRLVGVCMEVHRRLGPGFLEGVYGEALSMELELKKIPFVQEEKINIKYRNRLLEKYYIADFICFGKIILEIKALSRLTAEHEAQVLNYLKATGLKLGLLVNFGEKSLKFKRLINI